jgi:hypothetical protein
MKRGHHEDDDEGRQSRGLLALAIVLMLGLAASYLVRALAREGFIEDCLLAHRLNCDALLDER